MLGYAIFSFKPGEIPTDFSDKLHPRIDIGAITKPDFHVVNLCT